MAWRGWEGAGWEGAGWGGAGWGGEGKEWDARGRWGHEAAGHSWQDWPGSPTTGAEEADEKEKEKLKNLTSFGCGGQKPLPLEKRKDIFLALTEALDPTVFPSKLAVAAWGAEVTMAAFWILTKTGPKTPLRWLKHEDGSFSVEHAVKVLKSACLSHYREEADLKEVLKFICEHAWSRCDEIVARACETGFDPSDVVELNKQMHLAQALAHQAAGAPSKQQALVHALSLQSSAQSLTGLGSGAQALAPRGPKWDSRSGGRPPTNNDRALRRSDTEEEINRLERRKKLMALTKEVRGEEQTMALEGTAAKPTELTGIGSGTLPAGLTIGAGKAATLRGVGDKAPNLPPGFYADQPALLAGAAGTGRATSDGAAVGGQLEQAAMNKKRQIAQLQAQLAENEARMATVSSHEAEVAGLLQEQKAQEERACQEELEEQRAHEQEKQQEVQGEEGMRASRAHLQESSLEQEVRALRTRLQQEEHACLAQQQEEGSREKNEQEAREQEVGEQKAREQEAHRLREQNEQAAREQEEERRALEQEAHRLREQNEQAAGEQEEEQRARERVQARASQQEQLLATEMAEMAQEQEKWVNKREEVAQIKEEQRRELAHMEQEMLVAQQEQARQQSELARMKQEILVAQEERQRESALMEKKLAEAKEEAQEQSEEREKQAQEESEEGEKQEELGQEHEPTKEDVGNGDDCDSVDQGEHASPKRQRRHS